MQSFIPSNEEIKEVKPDLVMDCTKTNFPDKYFDLIVFDPPHIVATKNNKGIFAKSYGTYTSIELRNFIYRAFKEFERILKDDGFVIFKWNTCDIPLNKILRYAVGFKALFGHQTAFRTKHASRTYWVCLRKEKLEDKKLLKWMSLEGK